MADWRLTLVIEFCYMLSAGCVVWRLTDSSKVDPLDVATLVVLLVGMVVIAVFGFGGM